MFFCDFKLSSSQDEFSSFVQYQQKSSHLLSHKDRQQQLISTVFVSMLSHE